jgi:hypothetical protein
MDKILRNTKSLIEQELNNEVFKGGYYDEEGILELVSFNGFEDPEEYKRNLNRFIKQISINLKNELQIIGTPNNKIDLLGDLHAILKKRLSEIDLYLNSEMGPLPGNALFNFVDKSKGAFYAEYPINNSDKNTLHNLRILLKEYYTLQRAGLKELELLINTAYNEVNLKERQAIYSKREPVKTFKWKGTAEQLKKLFDLANDKLFITDPGTFSTTFSIEPEIPKMPCKIKWIAKAGMNNQPCKMTLFYFIEYLHSQNLIEEGFSKKERDRKGNKKIFNMIESYFKLNDTESIKNIPISFCNYKKKSPKYPEIAVTIETILG